MAYKKNLLFTYPLLKYQTVAIKPLSATFLFSFQFPPCWKDKMPTGSTRALAEGLHSLPWFVMIFCWLIVAYVTYYRVFHPLSKYPGPFLASFSNLWKVYHLWGLHLPERLVQAHEKYGSVVRVGPSDLSFQSGDAIAPIYKVGRAMKKTKFYDGFTAFKPNLFGTQDEEVYCLFPALVSHRQAFPI